MRTPCSDDGLCSGLRGPGHGLLSVLVEETVRPAYLRGWGNGSVPMQTSAMALPLSRWPGSALGAQLFIPRPPGLTVAERCCSRLPPGPEGASPGRFIPMVLVAAASKPCPCPEEVFISFPAGSSVWKHIPHQVQSGPPCHFLCNTLNRPPRSSCPGAAQGLRRFITSRLTP